MSSPFLNLIPCVWDPGFATRRDFDYSIENKPHIEVLADLGVEDNVEYRAEPGEGESVVRAFMRGPDESNACLPQVNKVEDFCFGANLESLRAEKGEASKSFVAWLDERSFAEGKACSRTYRGPLTSHTLYMELKKARFHCDDSNRSTGSRSSQSAATARNSANPNPDESLHKEPDAERRLIFVTDLDCWSIYALIGTASYYQAFALRDALYKHLAFENFIGVTFPPAGLAMFQLAFHLPYYVWRNSQKACEDHRRDSTGSPLRRTQDVSFLNWKSSESPSFLQEAQISCVVAGSDEWRWVAYCLVDTYFDATDKGKETVSKYHEDSLGDNGMRVDPLTFGGADADNPIRDPREYFLMVFRIRSAQAKREWQQVVMKVEESIREYRQTHDYSLSLSGERSSSKEAEDRDETVRKARDWVVWVSRLTKQLLQDLSKTVDSFERFGSEDATYFRNLSELANRQRPLPAIKTTFDELKSLKKKLEYSAESCDDFVRDLELHIILENNEVTNRQHEIAEDSKGLSVIMMLYVSPIALTVGIFSMNKDVIPFIPARFGSFVGLVLTFGMLGVVIYIAQVYHLWCRKIFMALVGQMRWNRQMRGPSLAMLRFRSGAFIDEQTRQAQRDVENEAG